jgi:peptide deformylase
MVSSIASRPSRTCRETDVILRIRTLGDPVLREPAKPVSEFGSSLRTLFDDMVETMVAAPGVGLAGPQVGLSLRLFVFDDGESGPTFMANPVLSDPVGELLEDEGCLSIPGPYYLTQRSARIRCTGQDLEGDPVEMIGEGLLARIFQHETDHLDGMLYVDRLDEEGRRDVLAQLRRIEMGLADPGRAPAD